MIYSQGNLNVDLQTYHYSPKKNPLNHAYSQLYPP